MMTDFFSILFLYDDSEILCFNCELVLRPPILGWDKKNKQTSISF